MRYLLIGLLLFACEQKPQIACGPGTQEENGVCVAIPTPIEGLLIEGIEGKLTTPKTTLSWSLTETPREDNLHDVVAIKDGLFAVGDSGTLLLSKDRGKSWQVQNSGTSHHLYDIAKSGDQLFTCGAKGTVLRRLADDKWDDLTITETDDLYRIYPEKSSIFVIGRGGTLARYNPESVSWNFPQKVTDKDLFAFAKLNQTYWAAGQGGTILKSKGGDLWEAETLGTQDLIYLRNYEDKLYAVASDGTTYQHDGKQWNKIAEPTPDVSLSDVWGDTLNGATSWLAVGADGAIFQRTALDQPWKRSPSGSNTNLNGAYGNDPFLFAIGEGGSILRLEPWNVWVSNNSDVPLRLRIGERAFVVASHTTKEVTAPIGQTLFEHLDEDLNVLQQTFQIEENKTYKLSCQADEEKKLSCDDLLGLEVQALPTE